MPFGTSRGRVGMTLAISNTSLLVPLMLGLLAALPLYALLAPPTRFLAFALFIDGPNNGTGIFLESKMIAAIARY